MSETSSGVEGPALQVIEGRDGQESSFDHDEVADEDYHTDEVLSEGEIDNEEQESEQPSRSDERTITFHVYLSSAIQRELQLGKMEVRASHGGYQLYDGPALCDMRQIRGTSDGEIQPTFGTVWAGDYTVASSDTEPITYKYGIKLIDDDDDDYVELEEGISSHRVVNVLDKAYPINRYDGAVIFTTESSGEAITKSAIKAGFHAMQPDWIKEIQGEIHLDSLLSWVDDTEDVEEAFGARNERPTDVPRMLKQWVKRDIDQHIQWVNASEISATKDQRLLLSMIGLIYRSKQYMYISDTELAKKLNTLIIETMKRIKIHAKRWKSWLDGSLKTSTKELATRLQIVMEKMSEEEFHDSWPYLIPIYHYMRADECDIHDQPEERLRELSLNGLESCFKKRCETGFLNTKRFKKYFTNFYKDKNDWLQLMEGYLEGDPLLSYSLMEMMNDDEFEKFSTAYSALKPKFLNMGAVLLRYMGWHNARWPHKVDVTGNIIKALNIAHGQAFRQLRIHPQRIADMAETLLDCFVSKMKNSEYAEWINLKNALELYLAMLSLYWKNSKTSPTLDENFRTLWQFVKSHPTKESWEKTTLLARGGKASRILKEWENLSQISPTSDYVRQKWRTDWKRRFGDILTQTEAEEVAHSIEQSTVLEYLQACAEFVLLKRQWEENTAFQDAQLLHKIQPQITKIIKQTWGLCLGLSDDHVTITTEMLKKYQDFITVHDFYVRYGLSDECTTSIERMKNAVNSVIVSIFDDTCKLEDFKKLKSNKTGFITSAKRVIMPENDMFEHLFNEKLEQVEGYTRFAGDILKRPGCRVEWKKILPEEGAHLSFVTRYEAFHVQEKGREIVSNYNKYKDFTIFQALLTEEITASKLMEETVEAACQSTNQLVTSIEDEEMTIGELQEHYKKHYKDREGSLESELAGMKMKKRVIDKVRTCAVDFKSYRRKAKTLLRIKDLSGVNAEAGEISRVAQMREIWRLMKMKEIDDSFVKVLDSLIPPNVPEELDECQQKCLTSFRDSSKFVEWIRSIKAQNIDTYVHMIQEFHPLADDRAAKASQLLNVLHGYTPLIFHLELGENDLIKLHGLCQKVWQKVKDNRDLPELLIQWNCNLSILEKIGKGVYDSLFIAQTVNGTGVYEIGCIKKSCETLDDVILLSCAAVNDVNGRETQTFSYSDLEDIQSRLALAGDGEGNKAIIGYFHQMKDAVRRLAVVYLEIQRKACVLFESMKIIVRCNDKNQNQVVEVHLKTIDEVFYGHKSEVNSSLKHCNELHDYLRKCVDEWKNHTKKGRSDHKELNFYTTEQIVTLRKELGRFNFTDGSPRWLKQALPLLHMIYPIEHKDLLSIVHLEHIESESADFGSNSLENLPSKIQKDNYRAVQKLWPTEKPSDVLCIVKERGDKPFLTNDREPYAKFFCELQQSRDRLASELPKTLKENVAKTQNEPQLLARLQSLWDRFTDHTSSSIKGLLSLKHLALVLKRLKELSEAQKVKRGKPKWLNDGEVALIGIPISQIYKFVLSVYAEDASSTYPSRNEVLLCNEQTSKEELELFMHRALNDDDSCYCMVNCHVLTYDFCRMIEMEISGKGNGAYRLVFIYDEGKKKCFIRSCLDKFYCQPNQTINDAKLKEAFEKAVFYTSDNTKSCAADPRHYVKLIQSRRAGVGKTLLCEKLYKELRDPEESVKYVIISIHNSVDTDKIIQRLIDKVDLEETSGSLIVVHIDIASKVKTGVDNMLFNLLILKSLCHSDGRIWQAKANHHYLIECTMIPERDADDSKHHPEMLAFFPTIDCVSPRDVCMLYTGEETEYAINHHMDTKRTTKLFDKERLDDQNWQLVLKAWAWRSKSAGIYSPDEMEHVDNPYPYLKSLIDECGIKDPSWTELGSFVKFLGCQLSSVQKFLASPTGRLLQTSHGLDKFFVNFMVDMARDFSTHSLSISEETRMHHSSGNQDPAAETPNEYKLTKKWEQHDYPYLFFTADGQRFSTLGVCPSRRGRDPRKVYLSWKGSNDGSDHYIISSHLYEELRKNKLLPELHHNDFEDIDSRMGKFKARIVLEDFDRRREGSEARIDLEDHDRRMGGQENEIGLEDLVRKENCQKLREIMTCQTTCERSSQEPMFSHEGLEKNYVLTQDNAKKILAIFTRFRSDMPVIIMGETGCGKTKLVDFMSSLQIPTGLNGKVNTLHVLKVHGGTTDKEIQTAVSDADELAIKNQQKATEFAKTKKLKQVPLIYTILFFDEFNTTEEIGLIKEIMCDHRMNGEALKTCPTLRFIAACNPYRCMVVRSGSTDLRYIDDSVDRTPGEIRRLVYNVHPLPETLKSLVWDFGDLPTDMELCSSVEFKYIRAIIARTKYVNSGEEFQFGHVENEKKCSELIAMAQLFMRTKVEKEEFRFVSLRDVTRLLEVSCWFYNQRSNLFPMMKEKEGADSPKLTHSLRSLLLGLGVCYMSPLQHSKQEEFAKYLSPIISDIVNTEDSKIDCGDLLKDQMSLCKTVFADAVVHDSLSGQNSPNMPDCQSSEDIAQFHEHMFDIQTATTIPARNLQKWDKIFLETGLQTTRSGGNPADTQPHLSNDDRKLQTTERTAYEKGFRSMTTDKHFIQRSCSVSTTSALKSPKLQLLKIDKNRALKDNLFMMTTCFNTRIPLFVMGRPGTSKTLANSLLAKAMKGEESKSKFLRSLKCMHQESFQCSRHTSPKQIELVFEHCAKFQDSRNLREFVSVVLLDEIGLAEHAKQNPLKTLHSKLESSCYGDKKATKETCGFLGISNWALDPAKLNRGLFLRIEPPTEDELSNFGRNVLSPYDQDVNLLIKGYLTVCDELNPYEDGTSQFFGLRDFYSLIKMIAYFAESSEPTKPVLEYCIRRNFSGIASTPDKEPVKIFFRTTEPPHPSREAKSILPSGNADTIRSSLLDLHTEGFLTRYKMVISETLSILSVILDLLQEKDNEHSDKAPEVIFGKAFVDDISYTQVCQNVHKIRLCMAKGKTAVLLDVDDLHEGLYHLLNQYFYPWHEKMFVDLGIGGHKVPAHVHEDFRLLLIAAKEDAYSTSRFPIPLISRFEKHYISTATFLDDTSKMVKAKLDNWKIFEDSFKEVEREFFLSANIVYSTSFIGYSSEMTALIAQKASMSRYGQHFNLTALEAAVVKDSKKMMLQCATPESILRIDATDPNSEAAIIQQIYAKEQYHDDLLGYLKHELDNVSDDSLLIQATTFAEVIGDVESDFKAMENKLNMDGRKIELMGMMMASFRQEAVFKEALRDAYGAELKGDSRVLIVQCESANSQSRLVNAVRYMLQQEYRVKSTHTVLLLGLEHGQAFNSYQGGSWRCVHIDDPRLHSSSFTLPPLHECLKKKPYELIEEQEEVDDEMPDLVGSDDEDDPYRDRETGEEADATLSNKCAFPDIIGFISYCLPQALSFIRSQNDEFYDRAKVLTRLLTDRHDFASQFLTHVHDLLEKQDKLTDSGIHWTKVRAADASKMKIAETMRKALTDTLEEEFSPAIAAIIASIDPHRNLGLLEIEDNDDDKRTVELWLNIFKLPGEIGLKFNERLGNEFKMFHKGDESEMTFETKFPFSWIVKDLVDSLTGLSRDVSSGRDDTDDRQLSVLFDEQPIGKLLKEVNAGADEALLQSYMHDFIHLSHPFQPEPTEYEIIKHLIKKHLKKSFPANYGIPHIHIAYEHLKICLLNIAEVLRIEGSIAEKVKEKGIIDNPKDEKVDAIALRSLVEYLAHLAEDLKDPELWVAIADLCKGLAEKIIGDDATDHRGQWLKLEFKRLYVRHSVVPAVRCSIPNGGMLVNVIVGYSHVEGYHKEKDFKDAVTHVQNAQMFWMDFAKDRKEVEDAETACRLTNDFFVAFMCSNLVFPTNGCPDIEVIEWLTKFATFQGPSSFDIRQCDDDDAINSSEIQHVNPVLLKRYFGCLTYQPMRTHISKVINSLKNQPSMLKAFVQCFNDKEMEQHRRPIQTVSDYLRIREGWKHLTLEALQELADIQLLITSSVGQIYHPFANEIHLPPPIDQLLTASSKAEDRQVGYLAIRQICSMYGESFAIELINSSSDQFVIPADSQQSFKAFSLPDVFSAFGDNAYVHAKDWILQNGPKKRINPKNIARRFGNDISSMLQAIFTVFAWKPRLYSIPNEIPRRFVDLKYRQPQIQMFLQRLLAKEQWPKELSVNSSKGTHMSLLVVHMFTSASSHRQAYDTLPFQKIIMEPENAGRNLLPTMPDGVLDILMEQCGVTQQHIDGTDSIRVYVCPFGHPFIISQNGTRHCSECKSQKRSFDDRQMLYSRLLEDIEVADLKTTAGHTLGQACDRPKTPKGMRKCSPLSCAVIRCLTHLSMLASSLLYPSKVTGMIKPAIAGNQAVSFLSGHIWTDLQHIAHCCGESIESCILLLHHILHELGRDHGNKTAPNMNKIGERETWEKEFDIKYIVPTFTNKTSIMQEMLGRMKEDVAVKCSRCLKDLTATSDESVDRHSILMNSQLWDYDQRPTVENLLSQLHSSMQVHAAIDMLVENHDVLTALKYLPDIVELAKLISDKFHGQLSREKATSLTMKKFIEKQANNFQIPKGKLLSLVDRYICAWSACASASHIGFANAVEISRDSKMSQFVLDKYNMLMCHPLNLIRCLVEAHNEVVSTISVKESISGDSKFSGELDSMKATQSQLINVPNRDAIHHFLSTLHQHLNNGATKDQLDAIQNDALLDWVGSRQRLTLKIEDVPFYKFKEDFKLWKKIELLQHNQVKPAERLQISIMKFVNMNEDIKQLEHLINHLSAMPKYDPNMKLCDLTTKLCMETPSYLGEGTNHARDVKVKHVLHIWLLLKYSQAVLVIDRHPWQNPFVDIHGDYLEVGPGDIKKVVDENFDPCDDKTEAFLVHLFEFITLRLNKGVRCDDSKPENPGNQIDKALRHFVKRQNIGNHQLILTRFPILPPELLVCHAAHLWVHVWLRFKEKLVH